MDAADSPQGLQILSLDGAPGGDNQVVRPGARECPTQLSLPLPVVADNECYYFITLLLNLWPEAALRPSPRSPKGSLPPGTSGGDPCAQEACPIPGERGQGETWGRETVRPQKGGRHKNHSPSERGGTAFFIHP